MGALLNLKYSQFLVCFFFFKANLVQFGCTLSLYTVSCQEQKRRDLRGVRSVKLPPPGLPAGQICSYSKVRVQLRGECCTSGRRLLSLVGNCLLRTPNKQMPIFQGASMVPAPVERRKSTRRFPVWQTPAEEKHPKAAAPLAHMAPLTPAVAVTTVAVTAGGLEALGGSM